MPKRPMTEQEMQRSFERLQSGVASLDDRAHMILAMHASIERELDLALAAELPNPSALKRLGFGQKVGVWAAMQPGTADDIERLAAPLVRFNDLRNSVAHGDSTKKVDGCIASLVEAVPGTQGQEKSLTLWVVAGYIFGLLNVVED